MPGVLTVRDEGAARRYVFDQQAVVGRDLDCDIPLASRSVSRRHALVEKTPNGWVVRDLGSANGTSVGGARVQEAPLDTGDDRAFRRGRRRFRDRVAPDDERRAPHLFPLHRARAKGAPRRRVPRDDRGGDPAGRRDDLGALLRPRPGEGGCRVAVAGRHLELTKERRSAQPGIAQEARNVSSAR